MKLALTLLAKNEADVIDANVAFHLAAGVDFVIATDNGSTDGTTQILERYEQLGVLELIREPSTDFQQGQWVTRMARRAAERGADWVVNADADEFWWPRGGDLKEALERLPRRYGVIHGLWRPFVPRPDDDAHFAERLTVRLSEHAAIHDPSSPFRPARKSVHRARADVRVRDGNHDVEAPSLVRLHGWYPFEILHLPLRTRAQIDRKYSGGADRGLRFAADEARIAAAADALVVDDDELTRGLESGVLTHDTRLRDQLRTLAGVDALPRADEGQPMFRVPAHGDAAPTFARPSVVDDALFAVEAAVVSEADDVRLRRQVDQLERRLQSLETRVGPRVERRLRRFVRRSP
ncbi:MAG: glycosyltransferase family 2 protein [Gaiellaceae bacterium]